MGRVGTVYCANCIFADDCEERENVREIYYVLKRSKLVNPTGPLQVRVTCPRRTVRGREDGWKPSKQGGVFIE